MAPFAIVELLHAVPSCLSPNHLGPGSRTGVAFKHAPPGGATLRTAALGAVRYQRKASFAPFRVGRSCHSMPREAMVVGKAAR